MTFERLNIKEMVVYSYGEQPSDLNTIKLNTNENPYPPSESVGTALKNFNTNALRRYPDATAQALREIVGNLHGFPPDHILITNGGDEALRLAVTTFVSPEDGFGVLDPSYSLYPILANIHGAHRNEFKLPHSFELPGNDALLTGNWNFNAALSYITTPNAPSGRGYATRALAKLCEAQKGVTILDEAYADFATENAMHLTKRHPHLLVSRTFSKAYSLCFQRIGYFVGHPVLINALDRIRDSYNVNGLGQAAALATLSDIVP